MGAGQQCRMQGKTKSMDMKKRQGMTEYIRFADFPDIDDVAGIMNQIRLG